MSSIRYDPLVLSPDDLNADWLKVIQDPTTGTTYRESELALHDSIKLKHLPGRHDQQRHDPTKGAGGIAGLQPDKDRQQRFYDIMRNRDMDHYHKNEVIRKEIEDLPGGEQALFELEKWYWNPGDPDKALDPEDASGEHDMAVSDYENAVADGYEGEFEDYVAFDRVEELGYSYSNDTAISGTMQAIKEGRATPEQVEAMSAIYDYTQAYHRNNATTDYMLHRGMALDEFDIGNMEVGNSVRVSALGHWSDHEPTASRFAASNMGGDWQLGEVILHRKVPADEVFNSYLPKADKFGEFYQLEYEREVVPIATKDSYKILSVSTKKSEWTDDEVTHVWLE